MQRSFQTEHRHQGICLRSGIPFIHSLPHSLIGTHTHAPDIYWGPAVSLALHTQQSRPHMASWASSPIGSRTPMANTANARMGVLSESSVGYIIAWPLKEEAGVGEGEAWGREIQLTARRVPLLEQVAYQEPLPCTHRY